MKLVYTEVLSLSVAASGGAIFQCLSFGKEDVSESGEQLEKTLKLMQVPNLQGWFRRHGVGVERASAKW